MKVISVRNVAEALPEGIRYLADRGVREETRAGPALVSPVPVTTVYENPRERVLMNPVRDANPFFHLIESMWMLAGRGDAALLNNFVKDYGSRFAEPDGRIHGAYGARWRAHFFRETVKFTGVEIDGVPVTSLDQLPIIIRELSSDPGSRQAVLQMWDAETDLGVKGLKDRPCNTQVYFRRQQVPLIRGGDRTYDDVLDMTVLCRSNDIIWGAYGANAVHFSFLHEYMAAQIGVEVGTYYQVSNNYHAYISELKRLGERVDDSHMDLYHLADHLAGFTGYETRPLVDDRDSFDRELRYVLEGYECLDEGPPEESVHQNMLKLNNRFLGRTVWPMLMAHSAWSLRGLKDGTRLVRTQLWLSLVESEDWRTAAADWCNRRMKP